MPDTNAFRMRVLAFIRCFFVPVPKAFLLLLLYRGIFHYNFSPGVFSSISIFSRVRSLLQRKGHAEDHLSADHRRRAALLHVSRDGQLDPVSVQASVHVHLQPRSRRLQKSRFHGRGVHPGLQAVDPVSGVSGCRRIREHAWVIAIFLSFIFSLF